VASGWSSSIRPRKERERARAASEYAQWSQPSINVPPGEVQVLGMARRGVDKGKSKQVVEIGASSPPPTPVYSGPLAAAEYERMRKELETLKKVVRDGKKQLRKQNKVSFPSPFFSFHSCKKFRPSRSFGLRWPPKRRFVIDLSHTAIALISAMQARDAQEKLLAAASSKSRKNEELLQTIESALQCQICIELVSKPNVYVHPQNVSLVN
jgi:hypothetical protein